jgi:hypothetical protein
MRIVDRDDERPLRGQHANSGEERQGEGPRVRAAVVRLLAEQRRRQRVPLRPRQLVHDLVDDALEQVGEPGEREASLRLGRLGSEDPVSALADARDRRLPDGRLSDPRLTFEHQHGEAVRDGGAELLDRGELPLPPEERCLADDAAHLCLLILLGSKPKDKAAAGETLWFPRFGAVHGLLESPRSHGGGTT